MLNTPVLILNQNYQPLNVCNTKRAIVLLDLGKAELMQDSVGQINTVSKAFNIPSIIRLHRMVKIPIHGRRLSRIGVFVRDNHTCQYCGTYSKTLTLDHVTPRSKGGQHDWNNVVSACKRCNHHKGGRTPEQAKIELLAIPFVPNYAEYIYLQGRNILADQMDFLLGYIPKTSPIHHRIDLEKETPLV